ncbi:DUF2993 domain-containing protein [Pseudonocardia sp. GCM10023141]|uniref:LmeA family phospholipid-binding protein n=1 Tax=Pseudonocardia sp. GCM10023141 TaxID=3252653 RepID=UPI00360A9F3E
MRRVIIAALVLIVLLVAADFGAAALAESAVSKQMRQQIGLADDPSVRINGFPFLTQAISGQYGSVDVDATRLTVGRLQEVSISAQLRDVTAPLSMLLGSGPKTLQVKDMQGTARISAKDLQRLVPSLTDLRIDNIDATALQKAATTSGDASLAQIDPKNAVRLGGTATILTQKLDVSVIAVLELVDGQAQIVPRDIRLGGDGGTALPSYAQRPLQQMFTVRVDPGSLPLKVTPTSLQAKDGQLEISGTAHDLVLGAGTVAP